MKRIGLVLMVVLVSIFVNACSRAGETTSSNQAQQNSGMGRMMNSPEMMRQMMDSMMKDPDMMRQMMDRMMSDPKMIEMQAVLLRS